MAPGLFGQAGQCAFQMIVCLEIEPGSATANRSRAGESKYAPRLDSKWNLRVSIKTFMLYLGPLWIILIIPYPDMKG